MKLIKLESEEELEKSVFTNQLAYPLTLPEQCQVALKNITFQFDSPEFTIDDTNNTLRFKTMKGVTFFRNVVLSNGVYKLEDFLTELETKLNNAVMSAMETQKVTTEPGFQWKVSTVSRGSNEILDIAFSRSVSSSTIGQAGITPPINDNNGLSFQDNYFFKKINTDDNGKYNAKLFNNMPVCRGGFINEVQITTQTGGGNLANSNFIWGIDRQMDSIIYDSKTEIVSKLWCCIASNGSGAYQFKKGGVMQEPTTPIPIQNLDTLLIGKDDGKILYKVKRNAGGELLFYGDTVNDLGNIGASVNSYCLHVGNDATAKIAFTNLKLFVDPNGIESNGIYTINPITPNIYLDTTTYNNITSNKSVVIIEFLTQGIRSLLGFNNPVYTSPDEKSGNFYGTNGLTINWLKDDVEVEIMEMPFDNYSQSSRMRKNLIMIISQSELESNIITTGNDKAILSFKESANFAWMSLYNTTPLRYASLTVRATCQNKEISIRGRMSATLLYKPTSENN